ncbi:MAG: hypothetical protein N2235_08135 [Fischerella sp.]|nr:hypothetical protein [Fischerella sp.]
MVDDRQKNVYLFYPEEEHRNIILSGIFFIGLAISYLGWNFEGVIAEVSNMD